ncbi:MAG TPA: flagellar export chaperone FliS [Actinomycetales bacterium]
MSGFPTSGQSAYQRAAGRYSSQSIGTTSSPARLLVLLYDRLVLDLSRAHQAQLDGDRESASTNIVHAQDIVAELLSTLDVDAWDGGPQLARLYTWLMGEMIRANVSMDATKTLACREICDSLRQAWAQAELEALTSTTTVPATSLPLVGLTG